MKGAARRFTMGQPGTLADRMKAVAAFADQQTAVAVATSDTSATTDAWVFFIIGEGFAVEIVPAGRVQNSGLDLDFGVVRQVTGVIFADGFESPGWWGANWARSD